MKKTTRFYVIITAALFVLFILFTVAVKTVDVAAVGPLDSSVGFSKLNKTVFDLLGVHDIWYKISEWMIVAPLLTALGFAVLGFCRMIKRKSLWKVDACILLLAVFYVVLAASYILFEVCIINYRPTLTEGQLEASYPSSHTMLICCMMGSAGIAFHALKESKVSRFFFDGFSILTIGVTVAGRLLSGVHWFTDIIGGLLISAALVMLYASVLRAVENGAFQIKKKNLVTSRQASPKKEREESQ